MIISLISAFLHKVISAVHITCNLDLFFAKMALEGGGLGKASFLELYVCTGWCLEFHDIVSVDLHNMHACMHESILVRSTTPLEEDFGEYAPSDEQ